MSATDDIKARLDIVDIISDTVALRKSGRNFLGFCPFHTNTKTPSFVVFPETQTWRCFGACADGGDLFSFVMKRDGSDFKEALQELAARAGVQLEHGPQTAQNVEKQNKLRQINEEAATYFHRLLTTTPAAQKVRDYLAGRALTAETMTIFQLGYAPDEWDALKSHLATLGYNEADLLAAGLIVERDDGSPGYDRFRHRLMIPIRDTRGRVIGFGARALADNQTPKYLNSPQTQLFDKSATVYGLDLARRYIRQADQAVIVEGYMDVIQAHQRGANNVVAQMGTALTERQLKILKRLTKNFVLALDSDAAGNAATLRGLNTARETLDRETVPVPTARGLIRYEGRLEADIRIAALPPGRDPDDILKEGLDVWQAIIDQAAPVVDFYFQAVTAGVDMDTAKGKSAAVRELMPILQDINNPVEREHYVQKLARLVHVDERTLMSEIENKRSPRRGRQAVSPPQPELPPEKVVTAGAGPVQSPRSKLEDYCLSLILANPTALAKANEILEEQQISGLTVNDLKQGDHREIFQAVQLWTASQTPEIELLIDIVDQSLETQLTTLLNQWRDSPTASFENIERELSIAVLRLRLQKLAEQINDLTFLQQEMMDKGDLESARHYTEMVEQYRQQRRKFEHIRDALSLVGKRRLEANRHGTAI